MTSRQDDDLGAVFDAHVASEFVARDVDATMATMTARQPPARPSGVIGYVRTL
jgi:hypothetical protein